MVEILKISAKDPSANSIRRAADVIRKGGLVIYPTETSYGIAADATDPRAVKKVYAVKKREKVPITIIVPDMKTAEWYCQLNEEERKIAHKMMPGPLTLIVKKRKFSKGLPNILSKEAIGFRVSSSKVASAIARAVGGPITATSANLSGEPPAFSIENLKPKLMYGVDLVLDAGQLPKIPPTTIAQITVKVDILREGPIKKEQIEMALR